MQVGVCHCKSFTTKIGGGCVRLSVIIPAIVVPVPTHMNESYTYEWVLHIWMSPTHMNESYAYEWVLHIWTSTLRHAVSSCMTYECVFVSVCLCDLWMRVRGCLSVRLMNVCSWVFVCVTHEWVFVSVRLCDLWMRVRECLSVWLKNQAHSVTNESQRLAFVSSWVSQRLASVSSWVFVTHEWGAQSQ